VSVALTQDDIPTALASCTDKVIVEARFLLVEVASVPSWNASDYNTAKAVRIKMNAAKHGTFGKASPQGELTMLIGNPGAFTVFEDAFDEAATSVMDPAVPGPKMGSKRFRIYIVEDEDQTPA
jgi:hypothetical protein